MLRYGRRAQVIVRVVQEDSIYPNMWRVEFVDRTLSDMVNLTRAKDAGATHGAGAPQPKKHNASRIWAAAGAFFQTPRYHPT